MNKLMYSLSLASAFCCSCYEVAANAEDVKKKQFVQEFTSEICKILFDSSKSQNKKIEELDAIFQKYLDCDYIKRRIIKTYARTNSAKKYDSSKLGDAAFRFLLSRYVKITTDYPTANVRNITIGQHNNAGSVAHFDIDAGRGKVFKGRVVLSKDNNSFKIKGATVNNIDLGEAGSIINKIKQDFGNDPNKFIEYVKKEYSQK